MRQRHKHRSCVVHLGFVGEERLVVVSIDLVPEQSAEQGRMRPLEAMLMMMKKAGSQQGLLWMGVGH